MSLCMSTTKGVRRGFTHNRSYFSFEFEQLFICIVSISKLFLSL